MDRKRSLFFLSVLFTASNLFVCCFLRSVRCLAQLLAKCERKSTYSIIDSRKHMQQSSTKPKKNMIPARQFEASATIPFNKFNKKEIWNAGSFTIMYLNTLTAVTKSINYKFVYKQSIHSVDSSCTHKWNSYHGFEFISPTKNYRSTEISRNQRVNRHAKRQHSHA